MTTTNSQAELAEAEAKLATAEQTLRDARFELDSVLDRIGAGDAGTTPDHLIRARATAEHAELALPVVERAVHDARERLQVQQAEVALDRHLAEIRRRGSALADSLTALAEPLAAFAEAATSYEQTVRAILRDDANVNNRHPRVQRGPTVRTSIDGVFIESGRPIGQLAKVLIPTFKAVGGSDALLGDLKVMAYGAPQIPIVEDQ